VPGLPGNHVIERSFSPAYFAAGDVPRLVAGLIFANSGSRTLDWPHRVGRYRSVTPVCRSTGLNWHCRPGATFRLRPLLFPKRTCFGTLTGCYSVPVARNGGQSSNELSFKAAVG
jgi:hypothetical protein